jgi:hypothetical protein
MGHPLVMAGAADANARRTRQKVGARHQGSEVRLTRIED